ncbi:MAG TPA: exodeoxyribonuclease VII large subunit [Virgibacillus sp.]|nr:exodeoxyribonuclease VII large subunit [Virgibacillus sp.]
MKDKYLTVTALTKYLKKKLELDPHLENVWLRGEISNFKLHSRGHMYLTLKDDQARIQAIMFAGDNRNLPFMPENGMNVLVQGQVSLFERYGQYQLYIKEMQPDGIGALYLAFEQLKDKLDKKGYFNSIHKKEIPSHPKHIAIITSPTGAAVRDILTTLKRRYPIVETTIIPVLVQGKNATPSIVRGIELANEMDIFDTIILGRGGGSIEDLWGFNEEQVAEAIYHSTIPIISAVGHETDTTISDFVADLRAPTPTGAAEVAVPSELELKQRISQQRQILTRYIQNKLAEENRHLNRLQVSYAFKYPAHLIRQKEQQLDTSIERLERIIKTLSNQKKERLQTLNKRILLQKPGQKLIDAKKQLQTSNEALQTEMKRILEKNHKDLFSTLDKLSLLNPLEVMKRGFSITYNQDNKIIKSIGQTEVDEDIQVYLEDGVLDCRVKNKKEGRK